jgi:hypothetical protein
MRSVAGTAESVVLTVGEPVTTAVRNALCPLGTGNTVRAELDPPAVESVSNGHRT